MTISFDTVLGVNGTLLRPWERDSGVNETSQNILDTRLLAAARLGDAHDIPGLIHAGARIQATNQLSSNNSLGLSTALTAATAGWTALHFAAAYGRTATCVILVGNGALIDAGDAENATAIHCAAFHGRSLLTLY